MGKKWLSKEQILEIVEKYKSGKFSVRHLARIYNRSHQSIKQLLINRDIVIDSDCGKWNKKYAVDDSYFDIIDTEDKAYFLGLMYADGCVYYNKKITLGLTEKDRNILDVFIKKIKFTGSLIIQKERSFVSENGKTYITKPCLILNITNKKLVEQLVKLGCVPQKSLILKFPTEKQVPNHLLHHFIRGYFDGDGCFSVYLHNGYLDYVFCIASTLEFCNSLNEIVKKLDITTKIEFINKKRNNKISSKLLIRGRVQIYKFLDWIYKDATVYLERKYQKYITYKGDIHE